MNQDANNQTGGPRDSDPTPDLDPFTELQALSGALSAGNAPAGTPNPSGDGAPASGGAQGGDTPAPPAPTGGQAFEQMMKAVEKLANRVDKQGQYLTKLSSKMDAQAGDLRSEFERRFQQSRDTRQDTGDDTPPSFDPNQFAAQLTKNMREQMAREFAPLVQQTASNTILQRIYAAQQDPEVAKMVSELPPEIRIDLANQVHQVAGDKLFQAPSELYEEPDHVRDAIEMIHYRSVVKPGRRTGSQAVSGGQQAGNQSPTGGGFSPVPNTGTRSQETGTNAEAQEASQLFGQPVGKIKYPPGVARDLGIS